MTASFIKLVLYTVSAGLMIYGYESLHGLAIDAFIQSQYGGHLQFLTIQGLALSCLTMVLAFISHISESNLIRIAKRALVMVALPVEVVIIAVYWPLVLLAPVLILKQNNPNSEPSSDPLSSFRIPLRIDLALHAVPGVSLLLEFLLFETSYSQWETAYVAPLVSLICTVGYGWWVEWCASINGSFPYPFLEVQYRFRLLIYTAAGLLALFSFRAINRLHQKITSRGNHPVMRNTLVH